MLSLFAFALALRLVLMPVTMHSDLAFLNYFPSLLAYQGVWDVYGHFGDYYFRPADGVVQMGYTYYHPLVYFFLGAGQWLFRGLSPDMPVFAQAFRPIYDHVAAPTEAQYFAGFSPRQIMTLNFWWKIPYLAAESFLVGVVWHAFKDVPEERRRMLFGWLLSPVVIFSAYVMGQHRMFVALFLWGTLAALHRRRPLLASLSLGLACLCDTTPLLLAPVFLMAAGNSWKERARMLFWLALPLLAVLGPLLVSSKGYALYAYYSPLLQNQSMKGIFRHMPGALSLGLKAGFGLAYLWVLWVLWKKNSEYSRKNDVVQLFAVACVVVLSFFYATTTTLIHYFLWVLPFLVYFRAWRPDWKKWLFPCLVALLFLFNLDSRRFNLGLLFPLGPEYWMSLPSLHERAAAVLPWGRVVALFRLLFSAGCLYLGFQAAFLLRRAAVLRRVD